MRHGIVEVGEPGEGEEGDEKRKDPDPARDRLGPSTLEQKEGAQRGQHQEALRTGCTDEKRRPGPMPPQTFVAADVAEEEQRA